MVFSIQGLFDDGVDLAKGEAQPHDEGHVEGHLHLELSSIGELVSVVEESAEVRPNQEDERSVESLLKRAYDDERGDRDEVVHGGEENGDQHDVKGGRVRPEDEVNLRLLLKYEQTGAEVDLQGIDGLGHALVGVQQAEHALEVGDRGDDREVRSRRDEQAEGRLVRLENHRETVVEVADVRHDVLVSAHAE